MRTIYYMIFIGALTFIIGAAIFIGVSIGMPRTNKKLIGHWVDVNGNSTLDINRKRMTFSYGTYSETYKYKTKNKDGVQYLVPVGNNSEFGLISELQVCEDGSLTAYEMILDANPHHYRFVKEGQLKEELEIKDLSVNLPKTIESKDIACFHLYFTNTGGSYGLDATRPIGYYIWEIEKDENGKYWMKFFVMGDSYRVITFPKTEISQMYVQGLAQLLEDEGIFIHNGYHMENNVDGNRYSLWVQYESGEYVDIEASGDAANTCIFKLAPLLDYAAKMQVFEERW